MICIDRIIWTSYIGGWKCRTHLRCCSPHCACWCWAMGMERPWSLASTMGMRSSADDVFLLRGIIDIRTYRPYRYHIDIVAHVLKTFGAPVLWLGAGITHHFHPVLGGSVSTVLIFLTESKMETHPSLFHCKESIELISRRLHYPSRYCLSLISGPDFVWLRSLLSAFVCWISLLQCMERGS